MRDESVPEKLSLTINILLVSLNVHTVYISYKSDTYQVLISLDVNTYSTT